MQRPHMPRFPCWAELAGVGGTRSVWQRDVRFFTSEMSGCNASTPPLGSWGRGATASLANRELNASAWPCAVCDTLGMCPGSGRGWRWPSLSRNPGLTEGPDPAGRYLWKQLP